MNHPQPPLQTPPNSTNNRSSPITSKLVLVIGLLIVVAFAMLGVIVLAISTKGSEQATPTSPAESVSAKPLVPARPVLPPEPVPPAANRANEVASLEAKLANDRAYQGIWTGAQTDLNLFLTIVSELVANDSGPADAVDLLKRKKLEGASIKLYLIFARVGHFPEDFSKNLSAHLDAVRGEPNLGTWAPTIKAGNIHDFTALAAWSRPEDAGYLREHLAAKKGGPLRWMELSEREKSNRLWLVDELAALQRLSLFGPLTSEEAKRLKAIVEEEKKPTLKKDFKLGDFTYNVKSVSIETSVGNGYAEKQASEDARFLVVEYTIRNDSDATATVQTGDFRIIDAAGRAYRPSTEANLALGKDFLISEVQPGLKKKLRVAFEMPTESANGVVTLVIPEKGFGAGSVRITLK